MIFLTTVALLLAANPAPPKPNDQSDPWRFANVKEWRVTISIDVLSATVAVLIAWWWNSAGGQAEPPVWMAAAFVPTVILYLLAEGPQNVGDIAEALDSPQSTVSRHLKVLRDRGLVTTERDGSTVVYSLADRRIIQALDLMRAMVMSSLNEQARLAQQLS